MGHLSYRPVFELVRGDAMPGTVAVAGGAGSLESLETVCSLYAVHRCEPIGVAGAPGFARVRLRLVTVLPSPASPGGRQRLGPPRALPPGRTNAGRLGDSGTAYRGSTAMALLRDCDCNSMGSQSQLRTSLSMDVGWCDGATQREHPTRELERTAQAGGEARCAGPGCNPGRRKLRRFRRKRRTGLRGAYRKGAYATGGPGMYAPS